MNTYIQKAYEILRKETPLKKDCGFLCSQICCKGGDNIGMGLFPFEEDFLKNKQDFSLHKSEGNFSYPFLTCKGHCNRYDRPLSCRIFPLFPLVIKDDDKENGDNIEIKVIYDPRAKNICPLAAEEIRLNRGFIRAVRRAAKVLAKDAVILDYMLNLSEEIIEIKKLEYMLTGKY